jgi:hypothetical protein
MCHRTSQVSLSEGHYSRELSGIIGIAGYKCWDSGGRCGSASRRREVWAVRVAGVCLGPGLLPSGARDSGPWVEGVVVGISDLLELRLVLP